MLKLIHFENTEKYTRGVSAVESILTLDRLRQSVAIKELEQSHGQSLSMRKTVSVPNFSQVCDSLRANVTFVMIFLFYFLVFMFQCNKAMAFMYILFVHYYCVCTLHCHEFECVIKQFIPNDQIKLCFHFCCLFLLLI